MHYVRALLGLTFPFFMLGEVASAAIPTGTPQLQVLLLSKKPRTATAATFAVVAPDGKTTCMLIGRYLRGKFIGPKELIAVNPEAPELGYRILYARSGEPTRVQFGSGWRADLHANKKTEQLEVVLRDEEGEMGEIVRASDPTGSGPAELIMEVFKPAFLDALSNILNSP
jgi:hypothetical protein